MTTKQTIFTVLAVLTIAAVALGLFTAGKSAGREQSQFDRLQTEVRELADSRRELEKRVDDLEHWRSRWGKQPGSAQ